MASILLGTTGTWGDLFPIIGLAKGLSRDGHSVQIASSPTYRELVEAEEIAFVGIGPPLGFAEYAAEPKILDGRLGGFAGFSYLFKHFIFPNLDRYVLDLRAALVGVDALFANPALIGAPIAAEANGVRHATISVFPGLIPTVHASALPTRLSAAPGAMGRAVNRASWVAGKMNMRRLFDPPVNRARQKVGLSPVSDSFFAPLSAGGPYLVLSSPSVVERPADWPARVELTGFVNWDRPSSWEMPDELLRFLNEPDPIILITLGASSSLDPQNFYGEAVGAAHDAGYRTLVLTGPIPTLIEPSGDDRTLYLPFAPLSLVASHCHAAIHHGGVGTTIELLQAGLPQLIVPRGFDQPQTALRMIKLGVARSLAWRIADQRRLHRELASLVELEHYREKAVEIQTQLATEDGLGRTVEAVNEGVA
jgi:UDP:flavonoid glycosyltransferase YjiC (YdhE family)